MVLHVSPESVIVGWHRWIQDNDPVVSKSKYSIDDQDKFCRIQPVRFSSNNLGHTSIILQGVIHRMQLTIQEWFHLYL